MMQRCCPSARSWISKSLSSQRSLFVAAAVVSVLATAVASPAATPKAAQSTATKAAPHKPSVAAKSKSTGSVAPRKPSARNNPSPPHKPNPTLPEGKPRRADDLRARAEIAGGAPHAAATRRFDAELRALDEADRILFPRPLDGLTPGWSWDHDRGADLSSGVPTGVPVETDNPSAQAAEAEWLHSLSLPNIGARMDPLVIKYLKFYRDSQQGQGIAKNWARKVGRYAPSLRAAFARAGLPTDLMWLSLIESGHNPAIYSAAGAAGLWQFIPETGRLYGLTVDRWVDERLDPFQSTHAAIKFLSDLRQRFGNWELAMAAYNMGPAGLLRTIRKFNTNDFWRLTSYEAGLPWETTLYVPKVLAIAIVMTNLKAFGLGDIEREPPAEFDSIEIEQGTTLGEVARAAGVDLPELEAINPQLLTGRAAPQAGDSERASTRVYLPTGSGSAALVGLKPGPRSHSSPTHRVRFGDTFATIAERYGTDEATLTALNGGSAREHLEQGTTLWVPSTDKPPNTDVAEAVVVSPERFTYPDLERVFYSVRDQDPLDEVAQAFGVTAEQLRWWNDLDPSALLQQGMVLQVYVNKQTDLSGVRYMRPSDTRVLVVGTETFFDYQEELAGRRRVVVNAEQGDTLVTLGKRYGMSSGMMERINHFSRNRQLAAGEKVVVYTKRSGSEPATALAQATESRPTPIEAPRPDVLPPLHRPTRATP